MSKGRGHNGQPLFDEEDDVDGKANGEVHLGESLKEHGEEETLQATQWAQRRLDIIILHH